MGPPYFKKWFPTTSYPVIVSAPMLGTSNGTLAAEVSKAGGLGIVPGGLFFTPNSSDLVNLDKELSTARQILGLADAPEKAIPVGVGFLTFHASLTSHFKQTAIPLLVKHKPQTVWLFAPDPEDSTAHRNVIQALNEAGASAWGLKVFVQVGSVAAARDAVSDGADVIVAQGVDAGGHQWAQGAGVVSLVPEVREMLQSEFPEREIALVAAGGVADGSGVAAALALGAEGAVMGTRFIVATESWAPERTRETILNTRDGGTSTLKSYVYDSVQGTGFWPKLYDGRAIIGPSMRDHKAGMPLEENISKYKEAQQAGDMSRKTYWSGTGVGLVRESLPAGKIVQKTRTDALKRIEEIRVLI